MTVSSTTNRKTFAGDDATTSFGTSPVVFFDSTDIAVYVTNDTTGVSTLLVENTDYTITGGSGSTGTISTVGGSSPYGAPATGTTLVIVRTLPLTQAVDLVNNDINDAEVQETALDKLVMICQQLQDSANRSAQLAFSDVSGADMTLPTPEANKLIGWNSTANGLANYNILSQGDLTVSAFMQTVLDDSSETAALETLFGGTVHWLVAGDPPAETALDEIYLDLTNPDNAGIIQPVFHIPASVNMTGGGNVQGVPVLFKGDISAATPNAGVAEINFIRMVGAINSDAGSKINFHMINGLLTVAADEAGNGAESAGILLTNRAIGPIGSGSAMGVWAGDLHVEKEAGVEDGKMVGLEVGVHKAPALGAAKNFGIHIWSADRGSITATRAGTALHIDGARGWTKFIEVLHTDGATDVLLLDKDGNFTVRAPTTDQSVTLTTNAANTTATLTVTGKTVVPASVSGVLLAEKGGQITIGATTDHPVVFFKNNIEVFRLPGSNMLWRSPSGMESTGAKSAALGANCPAATETAPYTWIAVQTSDASTVYLPVWK